MMPLWLVRKMGKLLEETPPGLAASDVNGGELKIEGVLKVIILGGDKQRNLVSFIACELPEGKEALVNVLTMITLGVLPEGYPHHDFLTGRGYDSDDIQIVMSESEQFIQKLYTEEEDEETDGHDFRISRNVCKIEKR